MDTSEILKKYRNIAVIGISDKPDRPGYYVPKYLRDHGYNIIPVNPNIESWDGIKSYRDISDVDENIDVIEIFRRPEAVLDIVRQSLNKKPKVIWMQEGIINEDAKKLAEENNITVVMDKCMMKEHMKLK
ncbi:CoA-binding protein [Picrophilus oshimae]|uniref:Succinyl-CoA synthetase n=1 Tax=Picrophilus torridus (strain ATCC 700027 / DSM 9790 / JCM 10055 / NBRC 100828 / KAW 2/3) TaxID=1122961 RepID=Q6L0M4_PICTO|nr:CoA-binding protein [Picrophilus oshimae]AAT43478.1 succinyl-CoA synthetase [Picrophilus oshimae DSM 9789]SMD30213.1 hypothetical protein SAMN02745355_0076 [Picrophilus oshimae DSM 9789]